MNGFTLVTGMRISSSATPDRNPRLTGPSARRVTPRTPGCCRRNSIQCSANNPTTPATTSQGGAASSTTVDQPRLPPPSNPRGMIQWYRDNRMHIPDFNERKKTNVTTRWPNLHSFEAVETHSWFRLRCIRYHAMNTKLSHRSPRVWLRSVVDRQRDEIREYH